MAQWIELLPCKHKDLSVSPQNPWKAERIEQHLYLMYTHSDKQ